MCKCVHVHMYTPIHMLTLQSLICHTHSLHRQSFSYLNVTSQQNEQNEVNSKLQERVNSFGWPVLKETGEESSKEGDKLKGSVLSGSGFAKKMYQKWLVCSCKTVNALCPGVHMNMLFYAVDSCNLWIYVSELFCACALVS